jgi:hypothetical protein
VQRIALRPPRRSAVPAALAAAVLASPGAALAQQSASDPLAPALAAMDALEYRAAAETLERFLAAGGGAAREHNRALELLGACRTYLDEGAAALAAFAELVRRDPGWTLPQTYPPRVRVLLDEAALAAAAPAEVALEEADPPSGSAAGTVAIRILRGDDTVDSVALLVRAPDGTIARTALARRQGLYLGALPASSLVGEAAVSFWVEAAAPSGFILARLGTEADPLRRVVDASGGPGEPSGGGASREGEAAETPWYATWWFWTAVGALVAGGAVAGTVLYLESGGGPRDGSAGNWEVW